MCLTIDDITVIRDFEARNASRDCLVAKIRLDFCFRNCSGRKKEVVLCFLPEVF